MQKKYQIIYADPPWAFDFSNRRLSEEVKGRLYPTMQAQDIINLKVGDIADKDCVLFLWVMSSEIPLALKCIEAWGFKYKTIAFTWVKTTSSGKYCFGGGNWTRSNPELCMLATRGRPKRLSASVRELVFSERREHSRKPDEIRGQSLICAATSRGRSSSADILQTAGTYGVMRWSPPSNLGASSN